MESMHLVLIETYWNVKIDNRYIAHKESKVLIETYWNVKYGDVSKIFAHHQVLIETYWNVKTDPVVITGDIRAGINRNILECKAQRMIASHLYLSVLIETYWNVK